MRIVLWRDADGKSRIFFYSVRRRPIRRGVDGSSASALRSRRSTLRRWRITVQNAQGVLILRTEYLKRCSLRAPSRESRPSRRARPRRSTDDEQERSLPLQVPETSKHGRNSSVRPAHLANASALARKRRLTPRTLSGQTYKQRDAYVEGPKAMDAGVTMATVAQANNRGKSGAFEIACVFFILFIFFLRRKRTHFFFVLVQRRTLRWSRWRTHVVVLDAHRLPCPRQLERQARDLPSRQEGEQAVNCYKAFFCLHSSRFARLRIGSGKKKSATPRRIFLFHLSILRTLLKESF